MSALSTNLQSGDFGILILFPSGRKLCRRRLIPKIQSIREVLIALRWQIDFESEQKVAAFNWRTAINCLATSGSEAYPFGDDVTHVFALANPLLINYITRL
jgi:hypothetical protein